MREIKFRGFSKKHQQWLTGNYILNRGAHFIAPVDEPADGKTWEDYEVNPDTVGQFTGLTDKNGREIYEGDVISIGDDHQYIEVRFVRGVFAFLWNGDLDDEFPTGSPTHEWAEVVGNIHDNPEMLKRR